MKVLTKILAGGIAIGSFAVATPASAQYYPNPYGGIGAIINGVLGGGGYGYPGYGYGGGNSQYAVNQCVGAVQARLNGGYGGYGAYGGYGYAQPYAYGNARVLGISRVEPRSGGGLTVRGVANSGRYANYGYGYNGQQQIDLTFKCKVDYRGFVSDIDIDPAQTNYGYNYQPYASPYGNDYSQYGYRRY
jgi:hypothetical protein